MPENNEEIRNAAAFLWRENYPFNYWINRIDKINQFNPEDRLEALVILFQLVDLYVHVLTAKLVDPYFQWYILKEELKPARKIHNTLRPLREQITEDLLADDESDDLIGEKWYFLEKVVEEIDKFEAIEVPEEVEDEGVELEWIALDLLGCPHELDEETSMQIPLEDPNDYIGYCNGLLNFWKRNLDVWNDIKHGFRVLPLNWDTLDKIDRQARSLGIETELDKLKEEYQDKNKNWSLQFYRMDTSGSNTAYDVDIHVYEADIRECIKFARIAYAGLYNLFNKEERLELSSMFEAYFGFPENRSHTLIEQQFTVSTRQINPNNQSIE